MNQGHENLELELNAGVAQLEKTREPQKLDSVGSSPTAGTTLESHQEDLREVSWSQGLPQRVYA